MPLRLSALQNGDFRRLLAAQAFPWLTANGATIAVVFTVIGAGDGAVGAGLVLAARTLPALALGLIGGVLADRLSRRTIALWCTATMCAAQVSIAAAVAFGGTGMLAFVLVATLTAGTAQALGASSLFALPRDYLPDQLLAPSQGIQRTVRNACSIVGPAAAGLLIANGGTLLVLAADACASLIAVALLATLTSRAVGATDSNTPTERVGAGVQLVRGWHEFRSRRWLVVSVSAFACALFAWSGAYAVLGPLSLQRLPDAPGVWGFIAGALAVGYLAGSGFAILYRPRHSVSWSLAWQAASAPLLVAFLLRADPPVLVVAAVLAGFGLEQAGAVWAAAMQEHVPSDALGRVSSYDYVASFGLVPLGYALAAPVADLVTVPVALGAAALLIAAPCLVAALSPATRAVRRRQSALAHVD